jgi:hypothetical protein
MKEDSSREEFGTGLETAQQWLAMVQDETPDPQRVEQLLLVLLEKKDFGGSAWFDMKLGVQAWVRRLIAEGLIPMEFIKYVSRL